MRRCTLGEEPHTGTKLALVNRRVNAPKVLLRSTEVIHGHLSRDRYAVFEPQSGPCSRLESGPFQEPLPLVMTPPVRRGGQVRTRTAPFAERSDCGGGNKARNLHLKGLSPSSHAFDLQWRSGWGTLLMARRGNTVAGVWRQPVESAGKVTTAMPGQHR